MTAATPRGGWARNLPLPVFSAGQKDAILRFFVAAAAVAAILVTGLAGPRAAVGSGDDAGMACLSSVQEPGRHAHADCVSVGERRP